MVARLSSTSRRNGRQSQSMSFGESTLHDHTSILDFSDTTTMTSQHKRSRDFPDANTSLARPPIQLENSLKKEVRSENLSPGKQKAARDRFIMRNNISVTQPGGLAEACGFKTNRILDYSHCQPMMRKYAPATEFVSMYAQQRLQPAQQKTSRKIPKKPTKILDAPGILDDFYANIIDWSQTHDLMAIGLGSTVYCWNPTTSEVSIIAELDPEGNNNKNVTSLKWSTQDTCLSIATSAGEVQIWNTSTGQLLRSMRGHGAERIAALSWSEPLLSSGGRDGSIWNHDVRVKNHKVSELSAHVGEVCGLQWRADGRFLASGGNDNTVNIWDARLSNTPKHQLTAHQAAVKALAWCPWQSNLLASGGGSADRQIHFWSAATGLCTNTIDAGSQVTSLHWNEEYREIAATQGYPTNAVTVWSYPTLAKQIEIAGAHDSRILDATLSKDGQTLVTCSADENIKFWSLFEHAPQRKVCHTGPFNSLFTPGRV